MAETTCPVFKPTEQEFKSFRRYIEEVVDPIAGKAGLCKVIPPPGWAASRRYAAEEMCKSVYIPAPIRQCISSTRSNGVYSVDVVENPPMTLAEFKEYADKRAPFPSSTAKAGCPGSAAVGVRRGRSSTAPRGVTDGGSSDEEDGGTGAGGYGGGYGPGFGGSGGGGAPSGAARGEDSEVARRVRMFWRSLGPNSEAPIYGADTLGTLFTEEDEDSWNVSRLDTILQLLKANLPGITTPMLYAGMWRSMFAFHVEDVNLYSINYLHRGDPKSWYGIPPDSRQRFESLAQAFFTEEFRACKHHMRHKTTMISPLQIQKAGIGYCTAVQEAGEFMITFPGAYHGGFNHGFNLAESTNFALDRWIREGRGAGYCRCSPHSVRIDVDRFETLVRQHRRIAGRDYTCLNGLAEAPVGALLTGGSIGDNSTSEGTVDDRPATASPDGGGGSSVGRNTGRTEESEREEKEEEVELDVQVFHCVCSNVRSVRHVRWTTNGRFFVIPSEKSSPSAPWPEEESISECPRCGVWGHKTCLEYGVPPQFALSEVGAAYCAITPACSNGGGGAASRDLGEDGETSATKSAPELSAKSRAGETGALSDVGTTKALGPSPPPVQASVFRPVCWMCLQEMEEVAAMAAGACGGGAAAPAPRRPGKGSGGSNSGAGSGGGESCSATRGREDEGSGRAKKMGSKKKDAKKKSGKASETAEAKTAKASEANDDAGGNGGSATGGAAEGKASVQPAVARTAGDSAALGPSKRARVGPRLVGKQVLVSDGVAVVLTGVVTAIEAGQARVHYKGRNAKLDEWIDVHSERFLSASEAKKQMRLTHLAMNPSAATTPSCSRGSTGTKRKAASGGGGKSGVAGSGGKRSKKSGEGGGVDTVKAIKSEAVNPKKGGKAGKAGDKKANPAKASTNTKTADGGGKKTGGGKKMKDGKTPAASRKKHGSSGDGKNGTCGKEGSDRSKTISPKSKSKAKANKKSPPEKNGGVAVGTTSDEGGKKAGKHAMGSSSLSQPNSGDKKFRPGTLSGGTANGNRKKSSIGGGSGGGSCTKKAKKDKESKKKTKKLGTVSSIKPATIAPPVVVQKEVPDHHVISNRRAVVLARTFAKETKEAQKDFEEAVAAAERSRIVREQRRKASSSPRGIRHPPSLDIAAYAAAAKPTGGARSAAGGGLKMVASSTSGTPGIPVKGGARWPELGFGGHSWGLAPFYRQDESDGRDADASSGLTRGKKPEGVKLEETSGSVGVPEPTATAAAAAAVVIGVPTRPRRTPKEMRRARVGAGEAVDLGGDAASRAWLARLRAVQDIPVGQVERCSHSLAVLLGTSPRDGSIRASLRALLVAETLRGGASQEVSAFVRSLAGLMADAASKSRPMQVLAPQVASEDDTPNNARHLAEQRQGAAAARHDSRFGAEDHALVSGARAARDDSCPAVASIRDAEGAAAYAHALVHLARSRSKQKAALALAAQDNASVDAAAVAAAAATEMLKKEGTGKKSKKNKKEACLRTVETSRASSLPPSPATRPEVAGTVPGEYPFSRSGDALLMHAKAMVGLKRTHRWVTAWLNAPCARPVKVEECMANPADAKSSSNINGTSNGTSTGASTSTSSGTSSGTSASASTNTSASASTSTNASTNASTSNSISNSNSASTGTSTSTSTSTSVSTNASTSISISNSTNTSTSKKRKPAVAGAGAGVRSCSSFGAGVPLAPATHASPLVAAAAASAAAAVAAAHHSPNSSVGAVLGWHNAIMSLPSYAPPGAEFAAAVLPSSATTPATCAGDAASASAVLHHRPYAHGGTRGGLSTDSAYNALLSWWSPQPPAAAQGLPAASMAPGVMAPGVMAPGVATAGATTLAAAAAGSTTLAGAHLSSEGGVSVTPGAIPSGESLRGELTSRTTGSEGGARHGGVDLLERWERIGAARIAPAGPGAEHQQNEEEMVIVDF